MKTDSNAETAAIAVAPVLNVVSSSPPLRVLVVELVIGTTSGKWPRIDPVGSTSVARYCSRFLISSIRSSEPTVGVSPLSTKQSYLLDTRLPPARVALSTDMRYRKPKRFCGHDSEWRKM